jgi:hypothetical protein
MAEHVSFTTNLNKTRPESNQHTPYVSQNRRGNEQSVGHKLPERR